MDELVEWLRGVLADDEAAARAATPGHWGASGHSVITSDDIEIIEASRADSAHIARHDPAQVLADVAAKRKILDAYTARADLVSRGGLTNRDPLGFVARTLASAYRHRPGWKDEWE